MVRRERLTIFFFNDAATTGIYTLALHGALPICGRYAGRFLDCIHVPARRFAEGDREDGAVAVDHIVSEQQRYFQPGAFDSHPLQFARIICGIGIEDRSHATCCDILLIAFAHGRTGRFPIAGEQRQLADFFFKDRKSVV